MESQVIDEPPLLTVRFTGPWTVDEVCDQPSRLLAECIARKRSLLLMDGTLLKPRKVSTGDRFRFGSSFQVIEEKLDKVAVAVAPELIDFEKFGERVARNRGINVRVFGDLDEARRWLTGSGRRSRGH